ncbi:MAG: hypothetical protein WBF43_12955 [Methylocella sp.]
MRQADREKFVELARNRVSKALKNIQLIGNLANRSNYDYTEEDAAKIMKALSDEVSACRKKFDVALKRNSKTTFELE